MSKIKTYFRCEAAGRENNEDNGKILNLGDKGVLLVVCDGMGGMNAGEVASALAVATIEKWFEPECLTAQVMSQPKEYLKQAIVGADTNIKNYSQSHPETEGMGSTVVMTWLIEKKVYVAWCGDSRAYRYNPQLGLERLSKDHSLVQTWVDAGQITEEQAFNHPQGNIITRSLGDPRGEAMPEAAEFTLYDNDVLLLCSDGLCGTLRDSEIEPILAGNADLKNACDGLWKADEAAGWHDNVTTAMAQVVSGGAMLSVAAQAVPEGPKEVEVLPEEAPASKKQAMPTNYIVYACAIVLFALVAMVTYKYLKPKPAAEEPAPTEQTVENPDQPNQNAQQAQPTQPTPQEPIVQPEEKQQVEPEKKEETTEEKKTEEKEEEKAGEKKTQEENNQEQTENK